MYPEVNHTDDTTQNLTVSALRLPVQNPDLGAILAY